MTQTKTKSDKACATNVSAAISMQSLSKKYGSSFAVDSISLQVDPGTRLGLIGPNGAGKSTTLRMLMGMLRPTSGTASVFGVNMTGNGASMRGRIGYVPEVHQIYPWMRVSDVIRFCKPMYDRWNDPRTESLLERFALSNSKRVKHLSKGMQVKLSLLIAVAADPDVLILDEPMSGLDPIARDEFVACIEEQTARRETTVIFSSHHMDEVERIADSIAVMNRGRILTCQTTLELKHSTRRIIVDTNGRKPDAERPAIESAETIFSQYVDGKWSLTIQGNVDQNATSLRALYGETNVVVESVKLDSFYRDRIQGDRISC